MNPEVTVDFRSLPIYRRRVAVYQAFVRLRPGGEILVVSHRDLDSLRQALEADHPDEFTWSSLTRGPPWWRVLITRTAARGK